MKSRVSQIYLGDKTTCIVQDRDFFDREEKLMTLIHQTHQSGGGRRALGFTVTREKTPAVRVLCHFVSVKMQLGSSPVLLMAVDKYETGK